MDKQGFFVKRNEDYSGPHKTLNDARADAGHGTNLPIYHGILKDDGTFEGAFVPKTKGKLC